MYLYSCSVEMHQDVAEQRRQHRLEQVTVV